MRRDEYDGAIRALRKSTPQRIPAPFRDFSVKTAIPFYLWPNTRRPTTESDTEHQFSMRLTPAFGRPLPHTGNNSGGPFFAVRRSTLQGDVAFLRGSPLRSLIVIFQPGRLTTDSRERTFERCNALQREKDCWYCSSKINPLRLIDTACPPSLFIYKWTWHSYDVIILLWYLFYGVI